MPCNYTGFCSWILRVFLLDIHDEWSNQVTLMTSHNFLNATHACAPKTLRPVTSPHKKQLFFTALQAMPWPSSKRVSELFWHCNYKVHLSLWRTKPEHTFSHNKTATKLGFRLARTCLVNGRDALLMQVVFHEDKRYLSSTQWRSAQNKWGRRIV